MFTYWPSPLQVATTCAPDIASVRFAGSVRPVAVSLDALPGSDFWDVKASSFLTAEFWLSVLLAVDVTGSTGHDNWLSRSSASDELLEAVGVNNALNSCNATTVSRTYQQ